MLSYMSLYTGSNCNDLSLLFKASTCFLSSFFSIQQQQKCYEKLNIFTFNPCLILDYNLTGSNSERIFFLT